MSANIKKVCIHGHPFLMCNIQGVINSRSLSSMHNVKIIVQTEMLAIIF